MPAGRNRRDNGVRTEAAAAGTSLSSRNRLSSHPSDPVLSKTAATPNSAAPKPARSPAVRAVGTRAGRFGHHHDSSDLIEPDPDRACSGCPRWLTADAVRKSAATIGLTLAFDIARGPACRAECHLRSRPVPRQAGPMSFAGLSVLVNGIFAWADRLRRRHGGLGLAYG